LPNNQEIGPRTQSVGYPGARQPIGPTNNVWPAERTTATPLSNPADGADTLPQMSRKFPVTWPAGENRFGQPPEGANRYPRSDQTGRSPFAPAGNSVETVLPPPEQIPPGIPSPPADRRGPESVPARPATESRYSDSPFDPPVETHTDLLNGSPEGMPL